MNDPSYDARILLEEILGAVPVESRGKNRTKKEKINMTSDAEKNEIEE
jgi:hypothetical protein